jgi:hypothetical protein
MKNESNLESEPTPEIYKTFFTQSLRPPMFGDIRRADGPELLEPGRVDFETIGRILSCHLIVEHYITKYLEALSPEFFDWGGARMQFFQKLRLASGEGSVLREHNLLSAIEALSKIRNRFSHNLEAKISDADVAPILASIKLSSPSLSIDELQKKMAPLALIELFTWALSAYMAGFHTGRLRAKEDPRVEP